MENGQFLKELLAVVSGNTTIISELRKIIEKLQDKLYDIPDKAEFKAYEKTGSSTELTVNDIKIMVGKIESRLDDIDKWQKVRLPILVGLITLVIYAIGFFFTLDKVADMINERHVPAPIEEVIK
jgi:hypothetical protein